MIYMLIYFSIKCRPKYSGYTYDITRVLINYNITYIFWQLFLVCTRIVEMDGSYHLLGRIADMLTLKGEFMLNGNPSVDTKMA